MYSKKVVKIYSKRQKVTSYRYIKQYYPNFQRAVARNFLSFFVETHDKNPLRAVNLKDEMVWYFQNEGKSVLHVL